MARKRGATGEIDLSAVVEELGVKGFVDLVGFKQIIDEYGVEEYIAQLSPDQREELRRQLQVKGS